MSKEILNYKQDRELLFSNLSYMSFQTQKKLVKCSYQLINKIMLVNLTLKKYLKIVSKTVVTFNVFYIFVAICCFCHLLRVDFLNIFEKIFT